MRPVEAGLAIRHWRPLSAAGLLVQFPDRIVRLEGDLVAVSLSKTGAQALRLLHFPQEMVRRARRLVLIMDTAQTRVVTALRGRASKPYRSKRRYKAFSEAGKCAKHAGLNGTCQTPSTTPDIGPQA
jgi:hypothetical protein